MHRSQTPGEKGGSTKLLRSCASPFGITRLPAMRRLRAMRSSTNCARRISSSVCTGIFMKTRKDVIHYLHPRHIFAVGAGSFGAPVRERPESTPRFYNLIEVWRDHRKMRVHTRA